MSGLSPPRKTGIENSSGGDSNTPKKEYGSIGQKEREKMEKLWQMKEKDQFLTLSMLLDKPVVVSKKNNLSNNKL